MATVGSRLLDSTIKNVYFVSHGITKVVDGSDLLYRQ